MLGVLCWSYVNFKKIIINHKTTKANKYYATEYTIQKRVMVNIDTEKKHYRSFLFFFFTWGIN